MKLLIDHSIFSTQAYGGVSRYFCEIIPRLRRHPSIETTVYAPLHQNPYLAQLGFSGRVPPGLNGGRTGRALRGANELLTRRHLRRNSYDLIHETNLSGRSYAGNTAKVLHTIHDLTPELYPEEFVGYGSVMARRHAVLSSNCDFIAVSENTKADMTRFFDIADHRIQVIHHGASRLPEAPDVKRREDLCLYVGSRRGYKNFGRLLEAFALKRTLSAEVELRMFGGGALTAQERSDLEKAGVRRFSQLDGDDEALSRTYREAAAFIYPSLYEGFGLPLLEAMSSACPIVCSRASCFPEIADDAACYFDPRSSAEMAETLETVLSSTSIKKKLVSAGLLRVEKFSWEASARRHIRLYENIAGLN